MQNIESLLPAASPFARRERGLRSGFRQTALENPAGSRVRVGGAVLKDTPEPHNGCRKFRAASATALRFVSARELRHRNLRGIYMRVAEQGEVRTSDPVAVISRPR